METNVQQVSLYFDSKSKALQYMQILPYSEVTLRQVDEGYNVIYVAKRATITTTSEDGVVTNN